MARPTLERDAECNPELTGDPGIADDDAPADIRSAESVRGEECLHAAAGKSDNEGMVGAILRDHGAAKGVGGCGGSGRDGHEHRSC